MAQRTLKRKRKKADPREVYLPVVQLGTTLKSENDDVDDIWTISTEDRHMEKCQPKHSQGKNPTYRNIYEFSQKHRTNIPLHKGYWKIPGLTNNLLGGHSEDFLAKRHLKEKGLYETKFRNWYSRLVHENTVVLPPIQTSTRAQENVTDSKGLSEKNYILSHLHNSGPVKRFARDEIHFPSVFSNRMGCRECRRIYTSEMFTENYLSRNLTSPACCKSPDEVENRIGIHHCDVLGERYCKKCTEKRNRRFSKALEESVPSSSGNAYVHYRPSKG